MDIFDRIAAESDPDDDIFLRVAEDAEPDRAPGSNLVRGAVSGLAKTGTSLVGAAGYLTGAKRLEDWAERAEQEQRAFWDPLGTSGTVGEVGGRFVGEIATAIPAAGAVVKGVGAVARGGKAGSKAARAVERALTSERKLARGAATAAVNAPIDVVQGVKEDKGFFLPGKLGAVAESVGFSGAAGSLGAYLASRRPRRYQGPELPPDFDAPAPFGPKVPDDFGAGPQAGPRVPDDFSAGPQLGPTQAPSTPRAPAVAEAVDDVARAEREALQAVDRRDPMSLSLEQLERELEPLPRTKRNAISRPRLREMSDDALLDHRGHQELIDIDASEARATWEYVEQMVAHTDTGQKMGIARAKKLYGDDFTDTAFWSTYGEEMSEALRDMGWDRKQLRQLWARINRPAKEAKNRQAITEELQRRGLWDDTDFNPASFMDDAGGSARAGAASAEVLGGIAGAGAGAASGAYAAGEDATPGERLRAAASMGLLGGVAGVAGMQAVRGAKNAPPAAAQGGLSQAQMQREQALAAKRAADDAAAAAERSAAQTARARERINQPSTPTPSNARYLPRTNDEWKEFYQRFMADPAAVMEADALRVSGQAQMQQGTRPVAADTKIAQAIADAWGGLELRDAKRKLSGVELLALRAQREANAARRGALRTALNALPANAPDRQWMEPLMGALEDQSIAQFERYTRDVSQTGRDLRLLQESVRTSDNPADWILRAERLAGGKPLSPENTAKLLNAVRRKDFAAAARIVGAQRQAGPLDKLGELWQTGLLSSVARPLRDVFGNTINLADKQVERMAATFFDRIFALGTGVRTADYSTRQSLRPIREGLVKGAESAAAIVRGGGDPDVIARATARYDFSRETMQTNPVLRAYTTFIRRTIGAADALVGEAALAGAMTEQARVFARQSAKPGTAQFDALVTKYLQDPPPEMAGLAMAQAKEVTWQNSTTLGDLGLALRQNNNALVRLLGKLTVPFVQTPSAMAAQTVRGSPFGLLGAPRDIYQIATKADIPAAQRKLVNRLAKTSVGSGWIALGYMMADDDKMTSWYPSDDRERRRWELEGRTESAVKLGGTWVSLLGVLGPQAQLMSVGAALRKMTADDPQWTAATALGTTAMGIGRAVGDSPMMQGVATVADFGAQVGSGDQDAIGESLNQAAQTFVTGWVPQVVQQAARASDVTPEGRVRVRQVREPGAPLQTAANAVMQGVPGLRQQVPVRRNALGQERATSVGGLLGVLSPARLSQETDDPRAQELWRTGAAVARTPRRRDEPQDVYEARQQALGDAAASVVEQVMQHPQYQAIATMDVAQLRQGLSGMMLEDGETPLPEIERLNRLSDEALRERYQGYVLEQAVSRARSAAGAPFINPRAGRTGGVLRALTR
jgi:hypothetical protein